MLPSAHLQGGTDMDKTKDGRRFRARALVLTAVCAVLATLALLAAAV